MQSSAIVRKLRAIHDKLLFECDVNLHAKLTKMQIEPQVFGLYVACATAAHACFREGC